MADDRAAPACEWLGSGGGSWELGLWVKSELPTTGAKAPVSLLPIFAEGEHDSGECGLGGQRSSRLDPVSSPSWGHGCGLEVAQPPKLDGIHECAAFWRS